LDFTNTLKTFLRQDPDIIMVGEIRDAKTANMAIRAALTGHLVLSTIHTNSATATISRLMDMGIPPFLIAGTLNMSVAQRLIRRLCSQCKQNKKMPMNGSLNYLVPAKN
jgi:type IV pilus assembly protein PilB